MYKRLFALFIIAFCLLRGVAEIFISAVPDALHNTGTAFAVHVYSWILIAIIVGSLLLVIRMIVSAYSFLYSVLLVIILAAGANNIFERIAYGAVIDPIRIQNWQGNSADIVIGIGCILLIWGMIQKKNI